jgi:hypothetical protein
MNALTITDLPVAETLDCATMSAVRGGIIHVTNPDSPSIFPLPASLPYPVGSILKDLHLPGHPAPQGYPVLDPRAQ